ncbi:MAG TPA: TIGR03960 family B12-binding radical SAM protein [Dehalococcoidales bacterium]|nr:TIGR03960 family B12-binding radical SAM protein [Dehalococcoidales bacterium]
MHKLDDILFQVGKPARYTGGEWQCVIKDWNTTDIKVALSFPDLYDIGMSNMALPILYEILNNQPDVLAERTYAPWKDMEAAMRSAGILLYSLETKHPLKEFDIIGFSLGYELGFTNVLNMLDLAQIPVLASDRDLSHPLIIAGGSSVLNPEPMSDFVDLFVIGEGEEVLVELIDVFRKWKKSQSGKEELLKQAAGIEGIYVPSLYRVEYKSDGTILSVSPRVAEASPVIRRRIVNRLPPPPLKPVVPLVEVVQDRAAIEIQRGCSRGCRFCQASNIYRPVRERSRDEVIEAVGKLLENCGYDEVSLVSLSTSDYPEIDQLVTALAKLYPDVTFSLPSLRIAASSIKLMETLPSGRKTGLTFAPEAGSERLRRIINKCIPEAVLMETAAIAFQRGWTTLKLYFMIGLPEETLEDVQYIVQLVEKIYHLGRELAGQRIKLGISLSTFVPKPHTPFQWAAQAQENDIILRHDMVKDGLARRGLKVSWQDPRTSLLEAVISRGDRHTGKVILEAWKSGCLFDAWSEHFKWENWRKAFDICGIDPAFYANRERSLEEILPWSHIDTGVTSQFLKREYLKAQQGQETPDCRYENCNACGFELTSPACLSRRKQTES